MRRVDYDEKLYRTYSEGRRYSPETERQWTAILAEYIPDKEGLLILDLGCGTGRFACLLADQFGAEVVGVEPADKMRAVAEDSSARPRVRYLKGRAEDIPLEDESCDFALLSMVLHHVEDLDACCRELRRVLRPGGRVLIRNCFGGRLETIPFYAFFPVAKAVDDERLPDLGEVRAGFVADGFEEVAFETVRQQIDPTLRDHYKRIRKGAISTFELISEEDIEAGFAAMEEAVRLDPDRGPVIEDIDVLVYEKPRAAPGLAHG